MVRFFHTADAHFGVENYGKIDQKTGLHTRFLDFVSSLECCVDRAIQEDIDFFLFCGDAYKTAYPTPTQQKQFLRLLYKLQQAKIPAIIIVGNHDHPLSFGKIHALDVFDTVPLSGIYVVSKPQIISLETKSGPVNIVGIPWPLRHNLVAKKKLFQQGGGVSPEKIASYISEKVGIIIENFAKKLQESSGDGAVSVLAGHLTVSSGTFSGSEKCAVFGRDPCFLPSQLAIPPFDYVALGHLHRFQDLNKNGYPPVVYSGSIERVDFGERNEKKGFCSVTINRHERDVGKRTSYKFVELPTRPMVQIEVRLESGKNQTKQILETIENSEKNLLDGAIVKIVYHIDGDNDDKVDLSAIQKKCSLAMCIASIVPVRKAQKRQRRVELNVAMDFESIIEKYITGKMQVDQGERDQKISPSRLKERAIKMYVELQEKKALDNG